MTAAHTLLDVENVRARIDEHLAEHLTGLRQLLATWGDDAAPLTAAVAQMLTGGKRLRAAFCYWSWRAHGGVRGTAQEDMVLEVGAALELFQAAALFHDDVMDDSDTRRGLPAAHRAFAHQHLMSGWNGDARRFGEAAAILLGDIALIHSERVFATLLEHADLDLRVRARAVFDLMRTEVSVGQYLDALAQVLPWGSDPRTDEERARAVIRAKSARYSVEHPIVLGATFAGADDTAVGACRAFGLPLGEAFQLRDDLLGVFGDPAETGKPAGDDLREGKRTVLVARAMHRALDRGDLVTVSALRTGLGNRDLDDMSVRRVADLIVATGASEEVELLIADLSREAYAALSTHALSEPGRDMLLQLAHAAVDRRT